MLVVTGGAGFIGSNLVAALGEEGEGPVVVCDRLDSPEKARNLEAHPVEAVVEPAGLAAFLDDHRAEVRGIFHMGAITSTTVSDVEAVYRANFRFSADVWEWAAEHGVPLIYASSAATYGDGSRGFDDDASPEMLDALEPLNPYGWSKHLFDRWAVRTVEEGGPRPPRWAGLKFFNVYGPNEYHKGHMRSWVAKNHSDAAAGRPVVLFRSHRDDVPDGGQARDFVYVRDCVEVMLWLHRTPGVDGLFNLGTGRARTFLDLAGALFDAVGREMEIRWVDTPEEIRDQYQYFTEARMDRLREAGYDRPFTSLEEGVGDYVASYLSTPDPYR